MTHRVVKVEGVFSQRHQIALDPTAIKEEVDRQYGNGDGGSAYAHLARAALYGYAQPPIGEKNESGEYDGFDGVIARRLGLHGDEIVIDIACGDGRFVELLARHYCPNGAVIGINNSANHYVPREALLKAEGFKHVAFVEGDAQDLSSTNIKDSVADCVTKKFLDYHLPHPRASYKECYRILKPGGRLCVASRDPGNQGRMWEFMNPISDELHRMSLDGETDLDYSQIQPPQTFYSRFNIEKVVAEMQAMGFVVDEVYRQSTVSTDPAQHSELWLPSRGVSEENAWLDYEHALMALATEFRNVDGSPFSVGSRDMFKAIHEVVKPVFDAEVAQYGHFTEAIEQGFVIGTKPVDDCPIAA